MFLLRTHSIHSNMSKNHVLVFLNIFNPVENIAPVGAQHMPILAIINKSSPRESRSEFFPRTHPIHSICPKIMFWWFLNFFNPVKNITSVGAQHMPILALIDKSSPRKSWSKILPRTHPIHSNMSKNHFWWLLNFFNPVKNIASVGVQHMAILASIDKSSPRESRSKFLPRTHPIHSNISKNHFLVIFELFQSGQKHRILGGSTYAYIGINWQKFAARITKWVFATNAHNTLQCVQKSCFGNFWTFSIQSKTSHPWGHNIRQY